MMRFYILLLSSFLALPAIALQWQDMWSTPDQQGQELMEKSQFKQAEEKFMRPDWAAAAAYRAGDYQKAAALYEGLADENSSYNKGNALAHLGRYEEAIKAYDKAIAFNPKNQDAIANRKLLKDLLEQEKNQEQQNQEQQNKEQQNKEQQNKEQQNKEQQNKEQQNKEQQNKEQQNKEQQEHAKEQGSEAEREKQQAKEQWLRLIPDDPGGLMREKFLRDHLRRQRGWYQ